MRIKAEDHWRCTNPACGCELQVESSAREESKNPRCACGAEMKKKYTSPVFTYLDFLRMEEAPKVTAREE